MHLSPFAIFLLTLKQKLCVLKTVLKVIMSVELLIINNSIHSPSLTFVKNKLQVVLNYILFTTNIHNEYKHFNEML